MKTIGVVVPTLFERQDYLRRALESLKEAGNAYVILMGPDVGRNSRDFAGLFDVLLEEPSIGNLPSKLSLALSSFPQQVDLVTWLGDDDELLPGSLDLLQTKFQENADLVLVYGACMYIDSLGNSIALNKSGPWAIKLARFGPFLAPQPGSLFRREAFEALGGLNSEAKLAFDMDLFLALSKRGRVEYVSQTLANFRWHEDSLTVSQRRSSVREAALVRLGHASRASKPIVRALNPFVEIATLMAGTFLSLRIKLRSKNYK